MSDVRRFRISSTESGERLDRCVSRHLGKPRNQVRRWIVEARVTIDGRTAKPATAVPEGAEIECAVPEPRAVGIEPQAGTLQVLYEDPEVAVIDKPAGLVVHPGAGRETDTLVHYLLDRYPEIAVVGGPGRPGVVHRLDLDTTGALAVARTERAYLRLAAAFAERRVSKTYLAVVYGTPRETDGRIDRPIGRHRRQRRKMQVRADGRPAVTRYRVVESAAGLSRLQLDLETGRTHQIRVHLKAIHHPLVGDPVYGEARWRDLPRPLHRSLRAFPRPALHAWRLAFDHPSTGAPVAVEAPVPEDLQRLWLEVANKPWT